MPSAILDRLLALYPDLDITQGYGMTECSAVLTFLDRRRPSRRGTPPAVGRSAAAGRDAVDPRRGGQRGATRRDRRGLGPGRQLHEGVLEQARGHRPRSFADGWYHTGDAGYIDDGGYLFLVDRVKDMIVTGGENVYSAEVESAISLHEAVMQVAVIGIPHDTWGEQVHAIVVVSEEVTVTEDEIKAFARERIAGYKIPKSVEFRTEPLPLSGAMKVLKRELRAPYWQGAERGVN